MMARTGSGEWTTPILSQHARDRCAEMGISTKVAKKIYRTRSLTWQGRPGTGSLLAFSDEEPKYGIVYHPSEEGPDIIVSVIFRSAQKYIRNGATFQVVDD